MNKHSCIVEQKRETDYLAGTIPFEIRVADGNHQPFLPDFDLQKIDGLETDACVPFSAVQSVETQINYLIASGKMPTSHMEKLTELGFLEYTYSNPAQGARTITGIQFHASERFIAKLDGTNQNGTAMAAPWDAIRKYGLVPFSDWPFDETIATWDQFYAAIPQNLLDKGKEFLTLFSVQYEWIVNGGAKGTDAQDMKTQLKHAPLCIGVPVCEPWDQEQPPTCSLTQSAHSVTVYNLDTLTHFLDHYVPFLKQFDLSYYIPYVMKGVVNIIPVSAIPPAPGLPASPTVPQVSNWLTSLATWLQGILNQLKGRSTLGSSSQQMSEFISFLSGKKTYIIGGLMIVLGLLQGDQTTILNGLAVITLRAGISKVAPAQQ